MTSAVETDEGVESFAALYEGQEKPSGHRHLRVGESFEGPVVHIAADVVLIEIDGKRQGAIDATELMNAEGEMTVVLGSRIRSQVVAIDRDGNVKLGRTAAKGAGSEAFEQAKAAGLPIEGTVKGVNKGGLEVEAHGLRAFCPLSQIDRFPVTDPSSLVGKQFRFAVTEVRGKNVVLSRRVLLDREAAETREQTLATLGVGAEITGTIVRVKDFGAFVDIGGIEALLPAGEVSRDRKTKIEEVLHEGDKIDVTVRAIGEPEANKRGEMVRKITLSLRANAEEREARGDAEAAAPRAPNARGGKREGGQGGGGSKGAPKPGFGTLGDLMAKFKK
jgi:small subunit ribosomal protein S1